MGILIGYTLSQATSRNVLIHPCTEARNLIREGMYVVIESVYNGHRERFLGIITRILAEHDLYRPDIKFLDIIVKRHRYVGDTSQTRIVVQASIIGVFRGNTLVSSDRPPLPGSEVYIAESRDLVPIYGYDVEKGIASHHIVLGSIYGYESKDIPAVLDLRALTMHLAIIGTTGSGKSNTVGVIIESLGRKERIDIGTNISMKTIPVMVIDANGDYIDYFEKPSLVPSYSHVYHIVFHSSPAHREGIISTEKTHRILLNLDLNVFTGSELAELILALYHGGRIEGKELQLSYLSRILSNISRIEVYAPQCISMDRVDLNCIVRNIESLIAMINEDREKRRVHSMTADAVIRALEVFYNRVVEKWRLIEVNSTKINEDFIDRITAPGSPSLAIVDFSSYGAVGVEPEIKQLIVYYLLTLLFNRFTYYRIRGDPRLLLFILEEAQNYAPNTSVYPIGFSVARKILATVATQGRKFGLCLCLVTQRPSYVDPIVMSMINTYIIHRISPGDLSFVNNVTGGLPRHVRARLTTMETGLAVVVGQMNIFPHPLYVKVYRRASHRMGSST